jgi:hypothetical protein
MTCTVQVQVAVFGVIENIQVNLRTFIVIMEVVVIQGSNIVLVVENLLILAVQGQFIVLLNVPKKLVGPINVPLKSQLEGDGCGCD